MISRRRGISDLVALRRWMFMALESGHFNWNFIFLGLRRRSVGERELLLLQDEWDQAMGALHVSLVGVAYCRRQGGLFDLDAIGVAYCAAGQ